MQWHYKTLHLDAAELDDEALNALGADGWEAYSVTPVLRTGDTVAFVYHLRKQAEPERRMGFRT